MSGDRPTFSEVWHRVADLRPRLRAAVQTYRQRFRGELWHVVQDPSSNQFFRINQPAYRFLGLLDGKRSVAEAWRLCADAIPDDAPTQNEVIRLLGQLYTSNLLYADLPGDTQALFERQRKRVQREIKNYLANILFIRIPLLDPDRLLNRWLPAAGWLFGPFGLVIWVVALLAGGYQLIGRGEELSEGVGGAISTDNLPYLYGCYAVIKLFHEMAHALACKKFGRQANSGGEVHTIGLMLLVFMPVPYVDASSAWALRNRAHRVIVGAAGMMAELFIAAIAAIVWTRTSEGAPVHAIAYNTMFVAGVSTVIFNGNPLLRYDGYYILSDLLEIPNLHQRSRDYLYYLVKRYAWGLKRAQDPSHTRREKAWLFGYAVTSFVYRCIVYAGILLFVADKLFLLGAIMAIAAVFTWVILPVGKFVRYLVSGPEIDRVRGRAVLTTLAAAALLVVGLGVVPAPDRVRAEGVVEPVEMAVVYAGADGFVEHIAPSGGAVAPGGEPLARCVNPDVATELERLAAERRRLEGERRRALASDVASSQIAAEQIGALDDRIARVREEAASLTVPPTMSGVWVCPQDDHIRGMYLNRGDRVGIVANLESVMVRAVATQPLAALLINEARPRVEMRVKGRPQSLLIGSVDKILPAGQERLPSAALGYDVGGPMQVAPDDERRTATLEPFFEVRTLPEAGSGLLPGQRVVVRFDLAQKPLLVQWWRSLRQLLQQRFRM